MCFLFGILEYIDTPAVLWDALLREIMLAVLDCELTIESVSYQEVRNWIAEDGVTCRSSVGFFTSFHLRTAYLCPCYPTDMKTSFPHEELNMAEGNEL